MVWTCGCARRLRRPFFFGTRDVAFGTYVPKQAPTKKSAHHTPDATSLGCNHLGGRLTRPHAAGITQIGPQTARLPQFGVGVGGALLTCLP